MHLRERGVKADGPLFDLPGGTVKMAVGASLTTYNFLVQSTVTSATNPTVGIVQDPRKREVWAGYAQLNIPVFSDQNALPLLRRLEFEASWRHDQYSDVAGTSNAKLAFNWNPIKSFTIRGGWGQSFRAPNFGEFSPISNVTWDGMEFRSGLYAERRPPQRPMCGRSARARFGSGEDVQRRLWLRLPLPADFRSAQAAIPRWPSECGISPTPNIGSSIPKRPSTGRSDSTTRRPAIFSPA